MRLVHINSIIITKQFISHRNSKRLGGSVGGAHIHVGYNFLESNEDIVDQLSFLLLYKIIVCCLVCV